MYITRVEIKAIRSIKHLVWEIDVASAAGWHVILGDNGSGKSTLTRCIALSLIGQRDAQFLRLEWDSWIRVGERQGSCELNISIHENIDFDTGPGLGPGPFYVDDNDNYTMDVGVMVLEGYIQNNGSIRRIPAFLTDATNATHNHLIAEKKFAGFSSSFGPFRRFTGGELEDEKLSESNPQAYRHLSAFSERVALTEGLKWLKQLQFEAIDTVDRNPDAALLIGSVRDFVNQGGLLPNGVRLLHISSAGVKFQDGNGSEILAEEMSDGYRSVLALTFELLRQLSVAYGPDIFQTQDGEKVTVKYPGVVQIDEVDAHLHPTWQKRIGFWFREYFPRMQFIVTTHSPLVCQAAEVGSIFLLPRPGSEENGRMLAGMERDRLIYGNILDAYGTEAFGSGVAARSDRAGDMLTELSGLNIKEIRTGLSDAEKERQAELRAMLPTDSPLF